MYNDKIKKGNGYIGYRIFLKGLLWIIFVKPLWVLWGLLVVERSNGRPAIAIGDL